MAQQITTLLLLTLLTTPGPSDGIDTITSNSWSIEVSTRNSCTPYLVAVRPGRTPRAVVSMPHWCAPVALDGRQVAWGTNVCDKHIPLDGQILQGGQCLVFEEPALFSVDSGHATAALAAVLWGGEAVNGVRYGVGAGPWPNLGVLPIPVPTGDTLRWTGKGWEIAGGAGCPAWQATQ